jgi:hypothetical protein
MCILGLRCGGAVQSRCIDGLATGLVNSSLALGAEYDRLLLGKRTTLYVGADFLASSVDVKVSYPSALASPEYAYLFLSPHIKVKLNAARI